MAAIPYATFQAGSIKQRQRHLSDPSRRRHNSESDVTPPLSPLNTGSGSESEQSSGSTTPRGRSSSFMEQLRHLQSSVPVLRTLSAQFSHATQQPVQENKE